jgi:hypothetical protein
VRAAGQNAQQNGVYVVLQGVTGGDPLMGGWAYLQVEPDGVTHEAMDLNSMGGGDADLGAAVVSPLDGVVTFVGVWDGSSTGFGNHLAILVDDERAAQRCYVHPAHLDAMFVREGQRVSAGELVATCGKSGSQPYAHCHLAQWPRSPVELGLPGGWDFWQTPGWQYPREWVASVTLDPEAWFWASVAKAGQAPPEVVRMILSGAQAAAVQAVVWGEYWNPDAADFAIPAAWRSEWRRGVWRGAPLASEQPVPEDPTEGKPAGSWQLFEQGCCVWLPGSEPSWNG